MRSPIGALVQLANRVDTPPPYVGRSNAFSRMWHGKNDAEHQLAAMGSVGTLFAIVDRLASETARVDWKLWKKAPSGLDEDRTEVTSHAALDLWAKPNAFYTRSLFVESFQQHLDLTGEAWWVVVRHPRARSVLMSLWPVPPHRIYPVPHPTKFLAGYVYTGPDGEQIPLEVDDVVPLRRPNPLDPYRGIGPVQAVLADIDSAKYSAQWNRNFFINSAQPGGIHKVERQLSDDEFQQFRDRWAEQHQGVANAHRVAIIEEGEFEPVTYTMRDMQFSELRNVQREIIREAFAFPKSELGTADDVNRANAEAGSLMLARGHTVPRLERVKNALNAHLLPMFGETAKGLEFDFRSPVPDDREADNAERTSKATAYRTYIEAGVEPEDAAEVVGLPVLRMVPKPPSIPAVPAQPVQPVEAPAARLQAHGHSHTRRPVAALPAPRNAQGNQADPDELPDLTPVQDSWLAALADLINQWQRILTDWRGVLVGRVGELVAAGDRDALAELEIDDIDDGTALVSAAMLRLAVEAARQVRAEAAQQGVDIEAGEPDEDSIGQTARMVTRTLARELAVSAGREAMRITKPDSEGDDEAERVANQVRTHLDDTDDARARHWLGNALTQAQHAGRTATMQRGELSAPTVAYYAQEQNDGRTCRYCLEVDGRWLGNSVASAAAEYPTGGYIRCEGGPRCRGMVVAVYRPKQVGDTP